MGRLETRKALFNPNLYRNRLRLKKCRRTFSQLGHILLISSSKASKNSSLCISAISRRYYVLRQPKIWIQVRQFLDLSIMSHVENSVCQNLYESPCSKNSKILLCSIFLLLVQNCFDYFLNDLGCSKVYLLAKLMILNVCYSSKQYK